jgi:hypothetical protein
MGGLNVNMSFKCMFALPGFISMYEAFIRVADERGIDHSHPEIVKAKGLAVEAQEEIDRRNGSTA